MMQQCTRGTKYSISGYASRWFEQIWCILEVLIFSPLTYNGEVTKLTWPKVTDIKKIRNIQIVDTHALTVHCEFQRVRITGVPLARCQTSKNATWSQVTYCDLVTWPLGSTGCRFFRNVSNCWLNSYGKFSLSAKNLTGGLKSTPPPPVWGLTSKFCSLMPPSSISRTFRPDLTWPVTSSVTSRLIFAPFLKS